MDDAQMGWIGAIIIGGIAASGGLLQRGFNLPDATVNVLQGILFISILVSETLRGSVFGARRKRPKDSPTSVTPSKTTPSSPSPSPSSPSPDPSAVAA